MNEEIRFPKYEEAFLKLYLPKLIKFKEEQIQELKDQLRKLQMDLKHDE